MSAAKRPCLTAFFEDAARPASLRGPVLLAELSRFALVLASTSGSLSPRLGGGWSLTVSRSCCMISSFCSVLSSNCSALDSGEGGASTVGFGSGVMASRLPGVSGCACTVTTPFRVDLTDCSAAAQIVTSAPSADSNFYGRDNAGDIEGKEVKGLGFIFDFCD